MLMHRLPHLLSVLNDFLKAFLTKIDNGFIWKCSSNTFRSIFSYRIKKIGNIKYWSFKSFLNNNLAWSQRKKSLQLFNSSLFQRKKKRKNPISFRELRKSQLSSNKFQFIDFLSHLTPKLPQSIKLQWVRNIFFQLIHHQKLKKPHYFSWSG